MLRAGVIGGANIKTGSILRGSSSSMKPPPSRGQAMGENQYGTIAGVVAQRPKTDWARTTWSLENPDVPCRLALRSCHSTLRLQWPHQRGMLSALC